MSDPDARDEVRFYQDAAGEFRWRRRAVNGEVVSDSGEGYQHLSDCVAEAQRQFGNTVIYTDEASGPLPE